ncbi:MAG: transketolase [Gammaproteobacteria bacterium]|nr:transketolase [Gammaproteobacteria bacterium]
MASHSELANALRVLSMDAVQRANSGHPGAPMGMADIAEVLWNGFLKHNPANPQWPDRDRFVLSNGHGSMLLYSLLHLTGYDLSLDDLKAFRQLHSKTPGHPEYGCAAGIETTTGPLGQGLANGVGMAIAEKSMAARFNQPGHEIVDHQTWVFVGDGCLMEGISHEACSLAGTLGLGKLNVIYDDNGISIDGAVGGWFTDDTPARFRAYGWQVIEAVDGHDADAIAAALATAKAQTDRPTLICCRTIIGKGSPNKAGSSAVHGAALGDDEVAAVRRQLDWHAPPFEIPPAISEGWSARGNGEAVEADWQQRFEAYRSSHPKQAAEFERLATGALPADWSSRVSEILEQAAATDKAVATRQASGGAIAAFAAVLPELFGGSADLGESNKTEWPGFRALSATQPDGNYLHYGVREFGMSAIMNGLALHGGFIPFGGTFLVFSDYSRNAIRLAALMRQRVVHVLTHDSIGLGEDGPTHQPVEHVSSLRLIPNLSVWRPCDQFETTVAWLDALERQDGPTALILSRQKTISPPRQASDVERIRRGGYIFSDCVGEPQLLLLATGSEVGPTLEAQQQLTEKNVRARVVSMPNPGHFEIQDESYRESVLPSDVTARIAIEAGSRACWYRYVGLNGKVIGIDTFGESAPAEELYELFGITADQIVKTADKLLAS